MLVSNSNTTKALAITMSSVGKYLKPPLVLVSLWVVRHLVMAISYPRYDAIMTKYVFDNNKSYHVCITILKMSWACIHFPRVEILALEDA